jgi:hypothetical protein
LEADEDREDCHESPDDKGYGEEWEEVVEAAAEGKEDKD